MTTARVRVAVLALVALLVTPAARADVELGAFGGVQYAASAASPSFGATLNAALNHEWRVEFLYSRQPSRASAVDASSLAAVERYLAAIQQETGEPEDRTRFFGLFLAGATRFVTAARGSVAQLTLGLGLGVKRKLSRRLALRAEARGFYVSGSSGGVGVCSGGCVFAFGGTGAWEGDLAAGLSFRF